MFDFSNLFFQIIQHFYFFRYFQLLPFAVVQLLAINQHIRYLFYLDKILRCFNLFVCLCYFT